MMIVIKCADYWSTDHGMHANRFYQQKQQHLQLEPSIGIFLAAQLLP